MIKFKKEPLGRISVIDTTNNTKLASLQPGLTVRINDNRDRLYIGNAAAREFDIELDKVVGCEDVDGTVTDYTGDANALIDKLGNFFFEVVDFGNVANKPTLYTYFGIWAEESDDLHNGLFEWSFGNGNDTPSNTGVIIPFDCELVGLCLSTEVLRNVKVEVRKGQEPSGKSVLTNATTGRNASVSFENSPVMYEAGSVVGFRTVYAQRGVLGAVVTAWFRRVTYAPPA